LQGFILLCVQAVLWYRSKTFGIGLTLAFVPVPLLLSPLLTWWRRSVTVLKSRTAADLIDSSPLDGARTFTDLLPLPLRQCLFICMMLFVAGLLTVSLKFVALLLLSLQGFLFFLRQNMHLASLIASPGLAPAFNLSLVVLVAQVAVLDLLSGSIWLCVATLVTYFAVIFYVLIVALWPATEPLVAAAAFVCAGIPALRALATDSPLSLFPLLSMCFVSAFILTAREPTTVGSSRRQTVVVVLVCVLPALAVPLWVSGLSLANTLVVWCVVCSVLAVLRSRRFGPASSSDHLANTFCVATCSLSVLVPLLLPLWAAVVVSGCAAGLWWALRRARTAPQPLQTEQETV
jgi:hypothetical protein